MRLSGLIASLDCQEVVAPPASLKNPLSSGAADGADALASQWATASVIALFGVAGLTVLSAVLGIVRYHTGGDQELFDAASGVTGIRWLLLVCRFPGCVLGPAIVMMGPAVEAAMTAVAASPTSVASVAVLVVSVAVSVAIVVIVAFATRPGASIRSQVINVGPLAAPEPDSVAGAYLLYHRPPAAWLHRVAKGTHEWAPPADDVSGSLTHFQREESMIGDFVSARRWYLAIDLSVSFVSVIVGSIRSGSEAVCWITRVSELAVALAILALVAALRPFLKPIDMAETIVISLGSIIISVLVLLGRVEAAEVVTFVSMGCFAVRMLAFGAVWVYERLMRGFKRTSRGHHRNFIIDALLAYPDGVAPRVNADELTDIPALADEATLRAADVLRDFVAQPSDDEKDPAAPSADVVGHRSRSSEARTRDSRFRVLDDDYDVVAEDAAVESQRCLGGPRVLANTGMDNPIVAAYGGDTDGAFGEQDLVSLPVHRRAVDVTATFAPSVPRRTAAERGVEL